MPLCSVLLFFVLDADIGHGKGVSHRYEEHIINVWLTLLQNYPQSTVLGKKNIRKRNRRLNNLPYVTVKTLPLPLENYKQTKSSLVCRAVNKLCKSYCVKNMHKELRGCVFFLYKKSDFNFIILEL